MAVLINTEGSDALVRYLDEIVNTKPLAREEEAELARRVRHGDMEARDKLAVANLRFVVSIARGYQRFGVPLSDLISAGNVGLLTAAERFDETRGWKFISYAVWWIRRAIFQALAEQSQVFRISMSRKDLMADISKFSSDYTRQYGVSPSMEEISSSLGVDEKMVVDTFRLYQRAVSLDAPIFEGEEATFSRVIADETQLQPDEAFSKLERERGVLKALERLKSREAEVLRLCFGLDGQDPQTLESIGERFGVTRERVRQIKEKALKRLRRSVYRLEPFFEDLE